MPYCIYTLLDCNTIATTPKDIECVSDEEAIKEAPRCSSVLN